MSGSSKQEAPLLAAGRKSPTLRIRVEPNRVGVTNQKRWAKSPHSEMNRRVNSWNTDTMAGAAKKGAPGFTAVFAIAGMLAVAYAMMRRRG